MARIYLLLALLGIALPYGALIPWLVDNGLDLALLIQHASTNPISTMGWLDVVVAAMTLLIFIIVDGQRSKVKWLLFPILGTLTVGVSFGLPLYLYLKESQQRN